MCHRASLEWHSTRRSYVLTRAGLGGVVAGRITHDLRRTAVRDFLEAGVDEGTIMLLCDWKTRSVFDRYNIINQDRLAAAVAKRFNGTVAAQSEGSPAARDPFSTYPVIRFTG